MKPRLPIPPLPPGQFDAALDAALHDDSLEPSSGFAGSVMAAVRAQAAAPPPIPFPWRRALPGILAASAALALLLVVLVAGVRIFSAVPFPLSAPAAAPSSWLGALASPAAQGVLLAAAVTGAALLVCRKILASGAPRL